MPIKAVVPVSGQADKAALIRQRGEINLWEKLDIQILEV